MKSISLVVCAVAAFTGCTMNNSTPLTAWGRKDVSMLDYRTDAGQCTVLAASANPMAEVAKQAGGITAANGQGQVLDSPNVDHSQDASGGAHQPTGGNSQQPTSTYRDSASADFVNRAAMAQRDQEMAAQRQRANALKFCLSSRGYTEFELTAEQRARLDKLPQGSDERRDYLYKLGTDEAVLAKQAVKK